MLLGLSRGHEVPASALRTLAVWFERLVAVRVRAQRDDHEIDGWVADWQLTALTSRWWRFAFSGGWLPTARMLLVKGNQEWSYEFGR